MDDIRLDDIGGLLTERSVWKMLGDLSRETLTASVMDARNVSIGKDGTFSLADGNKPLGKASGDKPSDKAFLAPEAQGGEENEAARVWSLGALAFYALMGVNVFEGKGGESQTAATEVPRIGSVHAGYELDSLIYRSLSYDPSARPSMADIHDAAEKALQQTPKPRKKLTGSAGNSYRASLVSFWPEEMAVIITLLIMMLAPLQMLAQGKAEIPNEMGNLVRSCVSLRSAANKEKVQRELQRDTKWTMMDEIAIDRNGECTTKDRVDMFGLNAIGFRVLKQHGGVTNSGGRFRDGRDPRYKYSFIEITVRKGAKVSYDITGREGSQLFAIIPHTANARFTASLIKKGGKAGAESKKDGVCYISLKDKVKKDDAMRLSISNMSGKNMSFVIINYNSRDHE